MSSSDRDSSIENEPHLRASHPVADFPEVDPSEQVADAILRAVAAKQTKDDTIEHAVWDEPVLTARPDIAVPEDEVTYSRWLNQKIEETSSTQTWLTVLLIVLASGPWGVVGVLIEATVIGTGRGSGFSLVAMAIIGPVTEEIMKIALALWVVEKRPYLFKSITQILICTVAGGLAFAGIENLMYLNIYIREASESIATWRWTVCTGLHMNCSFVAGIGLARIWDNAIRLRQRPQLGLGMPWFFTAMAGHGLYNFGVSLAESAGWLDFLH